MRRVQVLGGDGAYPGWWEGISDTQAWRRRPRSWVAEEHVLGDGKASNSVAQILGDGAARTGASNWAKQDLGVGGVSGLLYC